MARTSTLILAAAGALALAVGATAYRVVTEHGPRTQAMPPAVSTPHHFSFQAHEAPRLLPAVSFANPQGRATSLDAFRGRVVLLNLWATWCPPCRAEMPTLERLQARLGGPDFEVVALAIDRPEAVEAFFTRLELTALGAYVDASGEAGNLLEARGLPTTLLLDRDGREVGRTVGPAAWDSDEVIALIRRQLDLGQPPRQAVNDY